jgi:hypothetical protein
MAEDAMTEEQLCFCEKGLGIPIIQALGDLPSVTLPIAGKLEGAADFTLATPSDCSVSFSLLAQLTPLLANLECVAKILGIVVALKKFATNPLSKGPDLIKSIDEAKGCLTPFLIPQFCIALSIYDVLQLILNILGCLIEQVESLITVEAKFDWDAAQSDPLFTASLACANSNVKNSMQNLDKSMESINLTLEILKGLLGLASLDTVVEIPKKISLKGKDPTGILDALNDLKQTLQGLLDKINQSIDIKEARKLCTPS